MLVEISQQNLGHASLVNTTVYATPRSGEGCGRSWRSGRVGRQSIGHLATSASCNCVGTVRGVERMTCQDPERPAEEVQGGQSILLIAGSVSCTENHAQVS